MLTWLIYYQNDGAKKYHHKMTQEILTQPQDVKSTRKRLFMS